MKCINNHILSYCLIYGYFFSLPESFDCSFVSCFCWEGRILWVETICLECWIIVGLRDGIFRTKNKKKSTLRLHFLFKITVSSISSTILILCSPSLFNILMKTTKNWLFLVLFLFLNIIRILYIFKSSIRDSLSMFDRSRAFSMIVWSF